MSVILLNWAALPGPGGSDLQTLSVDRGRRQAHQRAVSSGRCPGGQLMTTATTLTTCQCGQRWIMNSAGRIICPSCGRTPPKVKRMGMNPQIARRG